MKITELKNIETKLMACKKCSKEHCNKKCTFYIPPDEWLEVVDALMARMLEEERRKVSEYKSEAEYLSSQDWTDYFLDRDTYIEDVNNIIHRLKKMSDNELIHFICSKGKCLNTLETFKTYDVAKRLRDNGWTPTPKQRSALINTAAIAINS